MCWKLTEQESPPAWTQEAYRPPRSKYTLCCSCWGVPRVGTPAGGRGTLGGCPPAGGYPRQAPPARGYPSWVPPARGTPGGRPLPGGGYPRWVPPARRGVPQAGAPLSGPWMGYPPPGPGKGVPPPTWTWDGVPPPPIWTWDGVPPPPPPISWMGYPPPEMWTDRQTENITSSRTTYAVG